MRDLFVIDDTGSPGNNSQSLLLKSSRYTSVAVLIQKEIRAELSSKIVTLIAKYSLLGIKEFHFTDLLNQRKEYRMLSKDEVKQIFQDFTEILMQFQYGVFVQTMTPESYAENGLEDDGTLSLEEKTLKFIILRIRHYVNAVNPIRNFEIMSDEGIGKKGTHRSYPELSAFTDKPQVSFFASHDDPLLQVADYFAFCLNKFQLIAIKNNRTAFDIWFMKTAKDAFRLFFASGFRPVLTKQDAGADEYDQFVLNRFKETGAYPFWERHNKKK
jgi:hypothetical protein